MKCTNPNCGAWRSRLHTCVICKRKLCGYCISWKMDDGKRHCLFSEDRTCADAHKAQLKEAHVVATVPGNGRRNPVVETTFDRLVRH